MIMDKIIERTRFEYSDGSSVNSNAVDVIWNKIKELFTPKLQWDSEEISCDGGSTLLATLYSVTNYHTSIQVYDPVNGTASVNWNGNLVFEGTLEECKQFCTDKVLNDFLKLCE